MTPIINPWFIYLLFVLGNLCAVLALLGGVGAFLMAIATFFGFIEDLFDDTSFKTWYKRGLVVLAIVWILGVFIPSRETIIQMYVAKMITPDNVTMTKDAILQFTNEIVQAIQGAL